MGQMRTITLLHANQASLRLGDTINSGYSRRALDSCGSFFFKKQLYWHIFAYTENVPLGELWHVCTPVKPSPQSREWTHPLSAKFPPGLLRSFPPPPPRLPGNQPLISFLSLQIYPHVLESCINGSRHHVRFWSAFYFEIHPYCVFQQFISFYC